ncbi:hypothetical protein ACFV0O_20025 [Kitasatospora sp. NPDC059577]|uniref:hypothetical protein n=1 Tax=Kitasatospora sp. NPDC059577 TaxID=3346873 RepID=UPI003681E5ED
MDRLHKRDQVSAVELVEAVDLWALGVQPESKPPQPAADAGHGLGPQDQGTFGKEAFGLIVTARPSRAWTPAEFTEAVHWTGPLRVPGLRVLFAALIGTGVALGAVNVLALSAAERHHAGWLAGVMPAALSLGSMLGGLAYGRHAWPGAPAKHLVAASVGFAAGWLPLLPAPAPAVAVLGAVLPGTFLAPLLTAAFLTVERLAPEGEATEAFAWLIACIGVGQAAGTALASLADTAGPLLVAAVPLAGAAFALWLLRRFNDRLSS